MAKKQRQPNLPKETLERARREMSQVDSVVTNLPAQSQASSEAIRAAALPKRATFQTAAHPTDLHAQYAYVLTDLKNILILATFLLAVLIVFSFVL